MLQLTPEQADAPNRAAQGAGDEMKARFEAIIEAWNRAVEKADRGVVSAPDSTMEDR